MFNMTNDTTVWTISDHLKTPEDMRSYLEAAFEDGDPELIATAIGDVARAVGATEVARKARISSKSLYKAFQFGGNPTLASFTSVIKALGLKLHIGI
jgi:probable addiction module antidote protein